MGEQIVHVVLFRWAPTAPDDVVARLDSLVGAMRDAVAGVVEASHGPSVSVEGLERGYDHALYVRFADVAARDGYLPHPAHLPVAELITAHARDVLVFDLEIPAPVNLPGPLAHQ